MRIFIPIILFVCSLFSCSTNEVDRVKQVHEQVYKGIDSLQRWVDNEFVLLIENKAPVTHLMISFEKGRRQYKKIEYAIEYFLPATARGINGPPLPEIEAEEHTVIEPGGFQVIEEQLYSFSSGYNDLRRESAKLRSLLQRTEVLWQTMQFREDQVFEAVRHELFRIITLGISGFDTPSSMLGIKEIPQSIAGIRQALAVFDKENKRGLFQHFDSASNYAMRHPDFNEFNRMEFITTYINPLTRNLLAFQQAIHVPIAPNAAGIKSGLPSLFEKDAFNVNFFTPDADAHINDTKIEVGKKLFFDNRISGNNQVSCATCHQPSRGFTDGLVKNKTFGGKGLLRRNTPSLINAGLQRAQFYDMRAVFLEDQVKNVIENKDEIHGDLANAVSIFEKDSSYANAFRQAFARPINERDVRIALASYVRSLQSFDTKFDRYMRGESVTLNSDELKGFNLFMGKAKCGTCHFMPLFGGTVPPAFTFTESEVIGVPGDAEGKKLDTDPGRYEIYQIENFKNAFKTPTVRNISATAPYMHNGVYSSLEQVMEFYNKGGGAGLGLSVPNQTLPFDSLSLNAMEITQVIAFMNTLSERN